MCIRAGDLVVLISEGEEASGGEKSPESSAPEIKLEPVAA